MKYGAIRKTKDGYEATFVRVLDHPPERIWAALTDPEEIRKWFVPTEFEPRVGGRLVEHHDHVGMDIEGKVTRFEKPRVFEHTWGSDDQSIRWELHAEGSRTRLELPYRFPSLEGAEGAIAGWHTSLDVLGSILDGEAPEAHVVPRGHVVEGEFVQKTPGKGAWEKLPELQRDYARRIHAEPRDDSADGRVDRPSDAPKPSSSRPR